MVGLWKPSNFMTDRGVLKGYPDGTFKPENSVTKAEFTVIVARLFDKYRSNTLPEPRYVRKQIDANQLTEAKYTNIKGFVDVTNTYWAYKEISELYDSQFEYKFTFNGNYELLFEPEHQLTRLETAGLFAICFDQFLNPDVTDKQLQETLTKMKDVIFRIAKTPTEFSDMWKEQEEAEQRGDKTQHLIFAQFRNQDRINGGDTAYPLAQTIVNFHNQGFITADASGMLYPKGSLSRAQFSTILYRIHKLVVSKKVFTKYSSIVSAASHMK
ncbi:S-layer homology domain-containing protein [Paenibacillus sp. S3N08]|uniref:S-layer homology domain-containing protein n=2 Tax=Paenibacillus agricola TaxID=2716264 RepID=A0ABX0J0X3_9BACL|nr:S-layer homology domain-containing protein [Paenibacillus agricola]